MFIVGTFLPSTKWAWVTPQFAQLMSIIGFVLLGLGILFFIIGIVKTKSNEAVPSFTFLFGLKKGIWELYKLERSIVEKAGKKGLTESKSNEILTTIRHDLRVTPKVVSSPLTEDETNRIIERTNKRFGNKGDQINKKMVNELNIVGIAIDKCGAGVSSLLSGNRKYDSINDNININRLYVKRDKKIKELRRLAYSLNTIILTFLYYTPIVKNISPSLNIPYELMKEVLDEEMQRQLETL